MGLGSIDFLLEKSFDGGKSCLPRPRWIQFGIFLMICGVTLHLFLGLKKNWLCWSPSDSLPSYLRRHSLRLAHWMPVAGNSKGEVCSRLDCAWTVSTMGESRHL